MLESEIETAGRGWLLEVRMPAHAGPDVPEHLHLTWTERFEIVTGTTLYRLNHATKKATEGEIIVMPPRQPHVHPWNPGDSELVYRQRDDFGGIDPDALQDVIGVFATRAGARSRSTRTFTPFTMSYRQTDNPAIRTHLRSLKRGCPGADSSGASVTSDSG